MNHLEFPARFARLLAGRTGCILAGAVLSEQAFGFARTATENGPLEWMQEVVLLAAAVFSGAAAIGLRGAERMAAFLAMLLYLVFLLRELELPATGPVTRYLASDAFRWHEAAVLAGLVLPYAALRHRYWRELLAYGTSLRGWPFALAALLVGIGAAFDGTPGFAGLPYFGTFLEETAELLAYAVLAAAAGWVLAGVCADEAPAAVPAHAGSGGAMGPEWRGS